MVALLFPGKDTITGKWESQPSVKGNVTSVVFKEDNSFEGYINRKPFVTGMYTFRDSILNFTDNGCDGAEGIYKILFFSNADSLRFQPILDPCIERQKGMSSLTLGRVRKLSL